MVVSSYESKVGSILFIVYGLEIGFSMGIILAKQWPMGVSPPLSPKLLVHVPVIYGKINPLIRIYI